MTAPRWHDEHTLNALISRDVVDRKVDQRREGGRKEKGGGWEGIHGLHIIAWSFWARDRLTHLDRSAADLLNLGFAEGWHTKYVYIVHTRIRQAPLGSRAPRAFPL